MDFKKIEKMKKVIRLQLFPMLIISAIMFFASELCSVKLNGELKN